MINSILECSKVWILFTVLQIQLALTVKKKIKTPSQYKRYVRLTIQHLTAWALILLWFINKCPHSRLRLTSVHLHISYPCSVNMINLSGNEIQDWHNICHGSIEEGQWSCGSGLCCVCCRWSWGTAPPCGTGSVGPGSCGRCSWSPGCDKRRWWGWPRSWRVTEWWPRTWQSLASAALCKTAWGSWGCGRAASRGRTVPRWWRGIWRPGSPAAVARDDGCPRFPHTWAQSVSAASWPRWRSSGKCPAWWAAAPARTQRN